MFERRLPLALLSLCLFGFRGGSARAPVLIVSGFDPATVTFTGTGAVASANFNSGTRDVFPVRRSGFFTSPPGNFDVLDAAPTLATAGADHSLGRAFLRGGLGVRLAKAGRPSAGPLLIVAVGRERLRRVFFRWAWAGNGIRWSAPLGEAPAPRAALSSCDSTSILTPSNSRTPSTSPPVRAPARPR